MAQPKTKKTLRMNIIQRLGPTGTRVLIAAIMAIGLVTAVSLFAASPGSGDFEAESMVLPTVAPPSP